MSAFLDQAARLETWKAKYKALAARHAELQIELAMLRGRLHERKRQGGRDEDTAPQV